MDGQSENPAESRPEPVAGTGPAGLVTAHLLRRAGISAGPILERGGRVGVIEFRAGASAAVAR